MTSSYSYHIICVSLPLPSQYDTLTTNGPWQAQQMCRREQHHGDGVQAGNTRGGMGERWAYMVCPLFFIFYSFCWLFYILPARPHQPNTPHRQPVLAWQGGLCPPCHVNIPSQCDQEGYNPPCHVNFPFWHDKEGIVPPCCIKYLVNYLVSSSILIYNIIFNVNKDIWIRPVKTS